MHVFSNTELKEYDIELIRSSNNDDDPISYCRWSDGTESWSKRRAGLHRIDGPALIEFSHRYTSTRAIFIGWYIDGKEITLLVEEWVSNFNIKLSDRGEFVDKEDILLFQMRFM